MSKSLSKDERLKNYFRQNGRNWLTARQSRRVNKKQLRANRKEK